MSDFLARMKSAAKADKKTIVLPEGEDPRTIEAAKKIVEEGLANLVVLGNPDASPSSTPALPRRSRPTPRSSPSCAPRRASPCPRPSSR